MSAATDFNWVLPLFYGVTALGFVLLGYGLIRLAFGKDIEHTDDRRIAVAIEDETPDTVTERDWKAIGLGLDDIPLEVDPPVRPRYYDAGWKP